MPSVFGKKTFGNNALTVSSSYFRRSSKLWMRRVCSAQWVTRCPLPGKSFRKWR